MLQIFNRGPCRILLNVRLVTECVNKNSVSEPLSFRLTFNKLFDEATTLTVDPRKTVMIRLMNHFKV